MADLIQIRRDTKANWATVNPVLAEGEQGFEKDTGRYKIGDGTTPWNSLTYKDEKGTGDYSHVEGKDTYAISTASHAEGMNTVSGISAYASITSVSEQTLTINKINKFIFNYDFAVNDSVIIITINSQIITGLTITVVSNPSSSATGTITVSGATPDNTWSKIIKFNNTGTSSHTEGYNTIASNGAHAEGSSTLAMANAAHAEGINTKAIGDFSHAEGSGSIAYGQISHVEGSGSIANQYGHAEGQIGIAAFTSTSVITGVSGNTLSLSGSIYFHRDNLALVVLSSGSAYVVYITNESSTSTNIVGATPDSSWIGGYIGYLYNSAISATHAEGMMTAALGGSGAHSEGNHTLALLSGAHAEGGYVRTMGTSAHGEGYKNYLSSKYGHGEGVFNLSPSVAIVSITSSNISAKTLTLSNVNPSWVGLECAYFYNSGSAFFQLIYKILAVDTTNKIITLSDMSYAPIWSASSSYLGMKAFILNGTDGPEANHVEGKYNISIGEASHVEGYTNLCNNCNEVHIEGIENAIMVGGCTHIEGRCNKVDSASTAHIEGEKHSVIVGHYSHVEGSQCVMASRYSHAEGIGTQAFANSTHVEGYGSKSCKIIKILSIDLNNNIIFCDNVDNITTGQTIVLPCYNNSNPNNFYTYQTTVSSVDSTNKTITPAATMSALSTITFIVDYISINTIDQYSAYGAHAEGYATMVNDQAAHAQGYKTIAVGANSTSGGNSTTAYAEGAVIFGKFGEATDAYSFNIANGTSLTNKGLATKILQDGNAYTDASWNAAGADYSEHFEWEDGNVNNEDRVGYFVTLHGEKIAKACTTDSYILGIISATPAVIGDTGELRWQGKFQTDEWGRIEYQDVTIPAVTETLTISAISELQTVPAVLDESGNVIKEEYTQYVIVTPEHIEEKVIIPEHTERQPILNPDYDTTKEYIPRQQRPEWSAVGTLGKLLVRDDSTCQVNSFCKPADGGIATKSDSGYRVLARISNNIIKVWFK